MSGKKLIVNLFDRIKRSYINNKKYSDAEWTEFMGVALDKTAAKMNLKSTRKRLSGNTDSRENLAMDVMLFNRAQWKKLYKRNADYDAFILPQAVIELENMRSPLRLSYCLWKLLCIRSPLRILICYQDDDIAITKITKLRLSLQDIVIKGNLMKDNKGEIFIIVGNEGVGENEPWERYWRVYEWRSRQFRELILTKM